jgi:hypothetical protein
MHIADCTIHNLVLNADTWGLVTNGLTVLQKLNLSMTCKETLKFIRVVVKGEPLRIALLVKGLERSSDEGDKIRFGSKRVDHIQNYNIKSIKAIQATNSFTRTVKHQRFEIRLENPFKTEDKQEVQRIFVDPRGDNLYYYNEGPCIGYKKFENISFLHIFTGKEGMCDKDMVKLLPYELKKLYYQ